MPAHVIGKLLVEIAVALKSLHQRLLQSAAHCTSQVGSRGESTPCSGFVMSKAYWYNFEEANGKCVISGQIHHACLRLASGPLDSQQMTTSTFDTRLWPTSSRRSSWDLISGVTVPFGQMPRKSLLCLWMNATEVRVLRCRSSRWTAHSFYLLT
jgi:hypothetical protein